MFFPRSTVASFLATVVTADFVVVGASSGDEQQGRTGGIPAISSGDDATPQRTSSAFHAHAEKERRFREDDDEDEDAARRLSSSSPADPTPDDRDIASSKSNRPLLLSADVDTGKIRGSNANANANRTHQRTTRKRTKKNAPTKNSKRKMMNGFRPRPPTNRPTIRPPPTDTSVCQISYGYCTEYVSSISNDNSIIIDVNDCDNNPCGGTTNLCSSPNNPYDCYVGAVVGLGNNDGVVDFGSCVNLAGIHTKNCTVTCNGYNNENYRCSSTRFSVQSEVVCKNKDACVDFYLSGGSSVVCSDLGCSDTSLSAKDSGVVCGYGSSCYASTVNLMNSTLSCEKSGSCVNAIIDTKDESVVNCIETFSCYNAKITGAKKVYCTGEKSCYGSEIELQDDGGKLYYYSDNAVLTFNFFERPPTVQPGCSRVKFDCCFKYKFVADAETGKNCFDYFGIELVKNGNGEVVSYNNCPLGPEVKCGL